jgi:predicted dehydrogenase
MSDSKFSPSSRREFLKNTGCIAAVSALSGITLPSVHAGGSDLIRVALIGCGGRGTGAAGQALSTRSGPSKLVAMADVFENKLRSSYENLKNAFAAQVDVPEDRKFIGFDAYQKAMDCLRPGDVAIFATPPAFRWVHFTYAIQKSLNVFMEKPVTVDGPTTRRMIQLADEADKKSLKVGVGLMVRHCQGRMQLWDRIRQGQIGDIMYLRAYRMGRPAGTAGPNAGDMSELLYQVKRFHSFMWASGGLFSDFNIHQIDECCWMKDAWPVRAQATGGRQYRGDSVDQNFDHYSVEYVFADGVRFLFTGQSQQACLEAPKARRSSQRTCTRRAASASSKTKIQTCAISRVRTWRGRSPNRMSPNPILISWNGTTS